jgi:hypothetical protein
MFRLIIRRRQSTISIIIASSECGHPAISMASSSGSAASRSKPSGSHLRTYGSGASRGIASSADASGFDIDEDVSDKELFGPLKPPRPGRERDNASLRVARGKSKRRL